MPLPEQVLFVITAFGLLVRRMHDPPLRKPMLFSNVAPVLFSSRMNPLRGADKFVLCV
nr:hypothetical protein [Sorangium cellulosum]